jgi:hypothetical protein
MGSKDSLVSVINDTKKYWNQYYDVTDLPETVKNEKTRTCNITCVAMITGEHPDEVLQKMFYKHGKNDRFQWEKNLVKYLESFGHKCKKVAGLAWPKARYIKDKELENIRNEIDKGKVILYHKKGHYHLIIGYKTEGRYTWYIGNDPAGDRRYSISERKRLSGHRVDYQEGFIKSEKIYGRCWSVTI